MKHSKRKKREANEIDDYKWTENSTSFYMIVLFLIFPLFFRNDYFDILESKTVIFVIVTWIYLILFMVLIWLESIFRAEKERKLKIVRREQLHKKCLNTKKSYLSLFFVIFLLAVVISTLCSGDIENAWYSPDCKLFGTRILILCCGMYLCVSKGYIINKAVRISFVIGIGTVFALSVLNRYGIDLLQMQSRLLEKQKDLYISTIGNVNILSGFICIFLPLLMGIFIYSDKPIEKGISIFMVYIGVMAGISTNSDSFFLGFSVSMIFFMWFCMTTLKKVLNYLDLCIVCTVAMITLRLVNKICKYDYVWRVLQESLIENIPWILIISIFVILRVVLTKYGIDINWLMIRRVVFSFIGIILICFVIYVIKVNITGDTSANKYLIFNEKWGTNRGFAWIHTCELFRELPFFKQLFGIGPGAFKEFFKVYNEERVAAGLPNFADPHSEYLYFMVSTGIVGLIGYVGMIVSAIIECLKVQKESTLIIAAVLFSWLAQGTVNNPLVFTIPYLFLFLAMCRYEIKCNN